MLKTETKYSNVNLFSQQMYSSQYQTCQGCTGIDRDVILPIVSQFTIKKKIEAVK